LYLFDTGSTEITIRVRNLVCKVFRRKLKSWMIYSIWFQFYTPLIMTINKLLLWTQLAYHSGRNSYIIQDTNSHISIANILGHNSNIFVSGVGRNSSQLMTLGPNWQAPNSPRPPFFKVSSTLIQIFPLIKKK